MLNPAWQPAQEEVERLINISHHFLSEAVAPKPPVTEPARMELPVLFATRDGMPGIQDADYLLRALSRQLNLPGGGTHPRHWDLCATGGPDALPETDLVVILADATLAATRNAYALIKDLAERTPAKIAVVFRSGEDLAAARRCYRRLAVGSIRFLNRPLVNLGCLPPPGPHFAAALSHAAQVIQSQFRDAVEASS